ncbi:hypothetical protein KCU78_g12562, partial [Aureobasidium melanogenum]
MLDETHAPLPNNTIDSNIYTLGRMGAHNIAIAGLPAGSPIDTAIAATHMRYAFPAMRVLLLVGIGGGVPSESIDIRLGDIVVSCPDGVYGGVVQVDRGKTVSASVHDDLFEIKGALNQPPVQLLNAVNALWTKHSRLGRFVKPDFVEFLETAAHKTPRLNARYQGAHEDRLFKACYTHVLNEPTCRMCDVNQVISQSPRRNNEPRIHFGLIASANNVRKDALTRDKLGKKLNILCFEMEAAGVMNNFQCLVIRGISDYADSHKNDKWQPYAAFAAAAYAKEVLTLLPVEEVAGTKTVQQHDEGILDPRLCHILTTPWHFVEFFSLINLLTKNLTKGPEDIQEGQSDGSRGSHTDLRGSIEKVSPQWTNPSWFEETFEMQGLCPAVVVQNSKTLDFMMAADSNIKLVVVELTIQARSKPFAQGSSRNVFYARTATSDSRFVLKDFINDNNHAEVIEDIRIQILIEDMRIQTLCKAFALEFNGLLKIEPPLDFIITSCLQTGIKTSSGPKGKYMSLERFREGEYIKYNNTYGWVDKNLSDDSSNQIAQAFSHFTFERSWGLFLVNNL